MQARWRDEHWAGVTGKHLKATAGKKCHTRRLNWFHSTTKQPLHHEVGSVAWENRLGIVHDNDELGHSTAKLLPYVKQLASDHCRVLPMAKKQTGQRISREWMVNNSTVSSTRTENENTECQRTSRHWRHTEGRSTGATAGAVSKAN